MCHVRNETRVRARVVSRVVWNSHLFPASRAVILGLGRQSGAGARGCWEYHFLVALCVVQPDIVSVHCTAKGWVKESELGGQGAGGKP